MPSLTRKLSLVLFALALLITSCSMPSAIEPSTPEAVDQATGADNIQPPAVPTVSPEFPYSGQGETLAMIQEVGSGNHRILLVDPLGFGFRDIRLPEGASLPNPSETGLAPDGNLYAYYTGSTENGDLTLVIYSLADTKVLIEIPLLSSDYPENFQQLADEFIDNDNVPADLSTVNPEDIAFELQAAFEFGIETLAWSPRSRYLAFSGQMDGPSSDLYILDSQTLRFWRLTTGSGMLQRLSWSPDGRWIMHASAFFVGAGSSLTNHVASRDGTDVLSFPPGVGLNGGIWLTSNKYTVNQSDNGPGSYQLMMLDARDGSVTTLFEGAFQSYAFDSDSSTILLQSYPFFDTDPVQGLYRIDTSQSYDVSLLTAPPVFSLNNIGLDHYPFSGILDEGGTVLISVDGSMRTISDQSWHPYPAPTKNLLALSYFQADSGLWIYDVDEDRRIDVNAGTVRLVAWRPDSDALFYVTGRELHVYTLDSGVDLVIYAWPGTPVSSIRLAWVTLP